MTYEEIARVAHEVNRAFCESIGDHSQPKWEDAPEWQRESAISGVSLHANADHTPEHTHECWMALKVSEGWVYGEVKDVEKKTHPCIVPYEDLPTHQKSKDYLFRAVVRALR